MLASGNKHESLIAEISAWLNVKSEVWWIAKVSEDTAHLTSSRYPSIPLFVIHAPRWINQSCVLSAKIYYDLVPFPLAWNQFTRFCCCVIKNSIYLSNRHIYTSHDTADSLETIIIIRTSKEEKKKLIACAVALLTQRQRGVLSRSSIRSLTSSSSVHITFNRRPTKRPAAVAVTSALRLERNRFCSNHRWCRNFVKLNLRSGKLSWKFIAFSRLDDMLIYITMLCGERVKSWRRI